MTFEQLLALRPHQIIMEPVPIEQLLRDCLFYPDSGLDGEIIRSCNRSFDRDRIVSFIYADPAVCRQDFLDEMDSFTGYKILATQAFKDEDFGIDHSPVSSSRAQPFSQWIVYQRLPGYGAEFGPERFSLLFFGGGDADGVFMFNSLFVSRRMAPKAFVSKTYLNEDHNPYADAFDSGLYPELIYVFEDNPGEDELPWASYMFSEDAGIHYGPGGRGRVSIWRELE